ncbi:hypothetical protein L2E82_42269 [Cichorium intybus]|uniref:Uncharacterized protein n=1 Tax=Cichorium intybus TaxID=13427 RepID=A0ACB8ZR53_CICIN|nr:hypothetical protein L2E82_42269 [Cichorium intybus]
MTDGLRVEGLRNLVFWTATCQMGRKEALLELMKSSEPGVASRMEDKAALEIEKERVKAKRKTEEFRRDLFMFW